MQAKKISILGVTGSVGQSAKSVVLKSPDLFDVCSVSAHCNVDKLVKAAVDLGAKRAVIADETKYAELRDKLSGTSIEPMAGSQALCEVASEDGLDLMLAAILGVAGLDSLMAALEAGVNVAVANKEPLVSAGPLVMEAARKSGAKILPVDSEHNAVFQVFEAQRKEAIKRIIITASGGPFRAFSYDQMCSVTKEQALKHPTWSMGAKITIDSATLMNKALEVIEASVLFDMPPNQVDVVVHPQSIVHSMVEYIDGSVLAQMGASDMCTPIAYALGWPDRIVTPGKTLDVFALQDLTFEAPDLNRFPALSLAYEVLEAGLSARVAMNAANEIVVGAFLEDRIGFTQIVDLVKDVVALCGTQTVSSLDEIKGLDLRARTLASEKI